MGSRCFQDISPYARYQHLSPHLRGIRSGAFVIPYTNSHIRTEGKSLSSLYFHTTRPCKLLQGRPINNSNDQAGRTFLQHISCDMDGTNVCVSQFGVLRSCSSLRLDETFASSTAAWYLVCFHKTSPQPVWRTPAATNFSILARMSAF